jgi:hypothetical protein
MLQGIKIEAEMSDFSNHALNLPLNGILCCAIV